MAKSNSNIERAWRLLTGRGTNKDANILDERYERMTPEERRRWDAGLEKAERSAHHWFTETLENEVNL